MKTKYVIVIPDGCADDPVDELGGLTPLQAAKIPNMDRIAQMGIIGTSNNVPKEQTPASDVATLSLFGYSPNDVYTGRAPLETAAMGIHLGPNDWAIRCNLIHAPDGHMRDFTAGHISSDDGKALIETLQTEWNGKELAGGKLEFHAGVSYRNILVWRGNSASNPFEGMKTQAPHDVPNQAISDHLPKHNDAGRGVLLQLMQSSQELFANHPTNQRRMVNAEKAATQIWLWGQGKAPKLTPFQEQYGKNGAIISAVDLVRGVGVLLGWHRIDVPGATGYLDTDYAAKGRYAIDALGAFDLVCVHIEAPDEASHEGKATEKVKALEQIDECIVGPLLAALPRYQNWRILVEPDHRTTLKTRAHAYGAVPFAAAGHGIVSLESSVRYDELAAKAGAMHFDPGHQLMKWFLGKD